MREFYVGYLPAPPGVRRFIISLAVSLLLLAAGLALVMADHQRDPGDAQWLSDVTEVEGYLIDQPCPAVMVPGSWPHMIILVSSGKHGAAEQISGHVGRRVRVRGTMLMRGDVRLIELSDHPQAVENLGPIEAFTPDSDLAAEPRTYIGEIVDPKCYNGAMKPGSGKTHKACASLCIRGGIPPMFVTQSDPDHPYLLLSDHAEHFTADELETIISFVGEPVEFSARPGAIADLPILCLDVASIRRRP